MPETARSGEVISEETAIVPAAETASVAPVFTPAELAGAYRHYYYYLL